MSGGLVCAACAAALIYTGPIDLVLPQGAQTIVQLVDGDRNPVAIEVSAAGSTSVMTTPVPVAADEKSGAKAVIIGAALPGWADVAIIPTGEGRPAVALNVTVEPARARRESDGPLTLELVLATIEEESVAEAGDDIAPMLAGITPEGWTLGQRTIGAKPYLHWVDEIRERARLPAGWSVIFPVTAKRLGHSPDMALWEAPAGLGEWQWRNADGRLQRTGRFGRHPAPPAAGVPAERRRTRPRSAPQEPPEPVIGKVAAAAGPAP